jgi:hypothetical protein
MAEDLLLFAFAVALLCFVLLLPFHPKTRVIPTGATHSLIVSGVVEGPRILLLLLSSPLLLLLNS